jgi:spermidine synthase
MAGRKRFEELDYRKTELGELILRRRLIPELDDREVYEIILGDAFLMTSLFTVVEEALGKFGTAATASAFPGESLDLAVGGLGLGHTARAALESPALGSLAVVEFLEPVIEWHRDGLVPLGPALNDDPRCRLVHGDFFAMAAAGHDGFDPRMPDRKWHAVLLDIDHSPENLLAAGNHSFYQLDGLRALRDRLHPGGVFGLWSDDPPEADFTAALEAVFGRCEIHVVPFANPHQDRDSRSTVYLAGGVG